MVMFRSWVFVVWFAVTMLGASLLLVSAITDSTMAQPKQQTAFSLELADEIPLLVAAAVNSPEETKKQALVIAEKATDKATSLRQSGWVELADGYDELAFYANNLDVTVTKEELAWQVGIIARGLMRLQNGDLPNLVGTESQWPAASDKKTAPANERVQQNSASGPVTPAPAPIPAP